MNNEDREVIRSTRRGVLAQEKTLVTVLNRFETIYQTMTSADLMTVDGSNFHTTLKHLRLANEAIKAARLNLALAVVVSDQKIVRLNG